MNDINKPEGDNIGGVVRFNFIPVTDVETIADAINGVVTKAIELVEGKKWFCEGNIA